MKAILLSIIFLSSFTGVANPMHYTCIMSTNTGYIKRSFELTLDHRHKDVIVNNSTTEFFRHDLVSINGLYVRDWAAFSIDTLKLPGYSVTELYLEPSLTQRKHVGTVLIRHTDVYGDSSVEHLYRCVYNDY